MSDWTDKWSLPCPVLASFEYERASGINRSEQGQFGAQAQWRRRPSTRKTYRLQWTVNTSTLNVLAAAIVQTPALTDGVQIPFVDDAQTAWTPTDHRVRLIEPLSVSLVQRDLWDVTGTFENA